MFQNNGPKRGVVSLQGGFQPSSTVNTFYGQQLKKTTSENEGSWDHSSHFLQMRYRHGSYSFYECMCRVNAIIVLRMDK